MSQTPNSSVPQSPGSPSSTKKPLLKRKWTWAVGVLVLLIVIGAATGKKNPKPSSNSTTSSAPSSSTTSSAPASSTTPTTTPATTTPAPPTARTVQGNAVTLGAGNFNVGTSVAPGLYNVTTGPGQSGNFIVTGTDSYDEILGGSSADSEVPEVRAQIGQGDQIQISSLSTVHFAPVTTPYVTGYARVTLFAGTWTVGQDLGPGTYTATPGAGQSGNFIIENENVDAILGGSSADGGVPSETFSVSNGDVIQISSLSTVVMTPS